MDNIGTAEAIFGVTNSYAPTKLSTAKALVSRAGAPVLFRNDYGKGQVWYAGLEYFRILTSVKIAREKLRVGKLSKELLTKLILGSGAQKKSDQIATALKTLGVTSPVVWRRDFDFARGAALAVPPCPQFATKVAQIERQMVN